MRDTRGDFEDHADFEKLDLLDGSDLCDRDDLVAKLFADLDARLLFVDDQRIDRDGPLRIARIDQ